MTCNAKSELLLVEMGDDGLAQPGPGADANKRRTIPGGEWKKDIDPGQATGVVSESRSTLDDAGHGAASLITAKLVSPFGPATETAGCHTLLGHSIVEYELLARI